MASVFRKNLERETLSPDTNAGLWLDRFLPNPTKTESGSVQTLVRSVTREVKPPTGYALAYERRRRVLEVADGGFEDGITRVYKATARGRVIVGIGAASVRETSISLLRVWGLPFLPGSALKGVAASVAHRTGDPNWSKGAPGDGAEPGAHHRALFGSPTEGGSVVFHDAWWVPSEKLPLDLDVMTVHHSAYYTGEGDDGPMDWDEPVPVSFVTASGTYLVALSGPEAWVALAEQFLRVGLDELGIGAKTAAGYGRMDFTREKTALERRREDLAQRLEVAADRCSQPGQIKEAFAEIAEVHRSGLHGARLRELWSTLATRPTMKSWIRSESRTDAERVLFGELEAIREAAARAATSAAAVAPAAPNVTAPAVEVEQEPWVSVFAWVAPDRKNRATIYWVARDRPDAKPADRELRHVEGARESELLSLLQQASPSSPLRVEAVFSGAQLKKVRRPTT